MTNQTPSNYRYNQMNFEEDKQIFERISFDGLVKEIQEHNLSIEYPDEESDSETESESELLYLKGFLTLDQYRQHLIDEYGVISDETYTYPGATEVFRIPELVRIIIEKLIEGEEDILKYRGINRLWDAIVVKYTLKLHQDVKFYYAVNKEIAEQFLDLIQTSPGLRVFLKEKSEYEFKGARLAREICENCGITDKEYQKDLVFVNQKRIEFRNKLGNNIFDNIDPKYLD